MKKKIIICLLLTICIACLGCTLTACSSNAVEYVESSFYVKDISYNEYSYRDYITLAANYEFKIKSTATCECDLKYVIAVKYTATGKTAFTKEFQYSGKIEHGETKTISKYSYWDEDDYADINYLKNNATIELISVEIDKIDPQGVNELYDGYAIGVGVSAAVILIGLTVVLIIDQVRKHKARK